MRLAGLSDAESCFVTDRSHRAAIAGFDRKNRRLCVPLAGGTTPLVPICFSMGVFALIAVLLALLGSAIWIAVAGWQAVGDVAIPAHGYIAMSLGIGFSLVVGCGLMALVFYSNRKGYDDPARRETKDDAR